MPAVDEITLEDDAARRRREPRVATCARAGARRVGARSVGAFRSIARDTLLTVMEARSFLGVPLRAANGDTLGHLAVIDTKPMPGDRPFQEVFQLEVPVVSWPAPPKRLVRSSPTARASNSNGCAPRPRSSRPVTISSSGWSGPRGT